MDATSCILTLIACLKEISSSYPFCQTEKKYTSVALVILNVLNILLLLEHLFLICWGSQAMGRKMNQNSELENNNNQDNNKTEDKGVELPTIKTD